MAQHTAPQPPIRRSIQVSWSQEAAFRRFTADFAKWWPNSCSIGGGRVERVVFECRVGGRIYEKHRDGTRFLWGTVTAFEPPVRVAFDWHSTREPVDAQHVEVRFEPDDGGTRVELVSSGWERLSDETRRSYRGYKMSWRAIVDAYAGRVSLMRVFFSAMSAVITLLGQRDSFVRGSRGRLPTESGIRQL